MSPSPFMNNETATIKRIDSVPTVTLIVQSSEGKPMGFLSGEAPALATWLETAAAEPEQTDPVSSISPVTQVSENFITPGQAVYEVEREFFLAVRGGLVFLNWRTILDLENSIPSGSKLFLVVSY